MHFILLTADVYLVAPQMLVVGKIPEAVLSVSGMNVRCTCKPICWLFTWLKSFRQLCVSCLALKSVVVDHC